MIAPFIVDDSLTLVLALPIGIGFGWALERAGFGNAKKLAGQFFLYDFTVFKVMFTAIVTALLGVFFLTRFGLLDASLLAIPETFLIPQLVGGLIFGVGFVVGGLCPGTSCVAAASGRLDGIAVVIGMFTGVVLFGVVSPGVQEFYQSTPRGALTLDQLALSKSVWVFIITIIALAGFKACDAILQSRR